jgi:phosphoglucosamine mutase
MRKLFGTDGIRAVAGTAPLDPQTIYATGVALSRLLPEAAAVRVVLGMDTRESSGWIAAMLAAGVAAGGGAVTSAGVIPTPAVAYLARRHGFAAGVVVSASHNPWQDNGIKIFSGNGYKLPDQQEAAIEAEIFRLIAAGIRPPAGPALPPAEETLAGEYLRFLLDAVPGLDLAGIKLVADCANGAASAIVPELLRTLKADAHLIHAAPNGRNINDRCGALHPEVVADAVKTSRA